MSFDSIGKLILGITVLLVHRRIRKEHKIDRRVLREIKKETAFALFGVYLILAAYVMHLTLIV